MRGARTEWGRRPSRGAAWRSPYGECVGSRRAAGAVAWGVLLLLAVAVQALPAADPPYGGLTLRLTPLSRMTRTGAPAWVLAEMEYHGPRILEGRLSLRFSDGSREVGTCESDELALSGGVQAFRLMIPGPLAPAGNADVLQVTASFVTASGAVDLGRHALPTPGALDRTVVSLICASEVGPPAREAPLLATCLNLARFDPRERAALGQRLLYYTARLEPAEMFGQALDYCAFDVVALAGDSLGALRTQQLDALQRWVQGGGSLLVRLTGPLKSHHLEFLGKLTGLPPEAFAADSTGRPAGLPAPLAERAVSLYRCGLGRVAIALEAPTPSPTTPLPEGEGGDADAPPWREATGFLFKLRPAVLAQVRVAGRWPEMPAKTDVTEIPGFQPGPLAFGQDMVTLLEPADIRVVPFGAVIGLLVLFVVIIGPADYFLLGALKRRKLTWLFFPAVSIGFAVATMLMANHYMGRTERRVSWTYVDVGHGDKVLRRDTYELVFPGRSGYLTTRPEAALLTEMSAVLREHRWMRAAGPAGLQPPLYRGRVPDGYEVVQRVEQWRPIVNRTLSLDGGKDDSGLDWSAVTTAALRAGAQGNTMGAVAERLTGGRAFDGGILVLNGDKTYPAYAALGRAQGLLEASPQRAYRMRVRYNVEQGKEPAGVPTSVLSETCAAPVDGFFRLASAVSPSGSENLEDAGVLDRQDPDEWLVAAVRRSGRNYVVYRRLYR